MIFLQSRRAHTSSCTRHADVTAHDTHDIESARRTHAIARTRHLIARACNHPRPRRRPLRRRRRRRPRPHPRSRPSGAREQSRGLATPRQAQREAQTRGLPRERWRRARGNKASQAAASSAGCTPGRLAQSCERHALVRGVGLRPGAAAVTFLRARNGGGEAAERVERDAEVEAAPAHDGERA